MMSTLKMASLFSQVQYIPQVERGAYVQKCQVSKISVRKTRKHVVVRACSEQKPPSRRSTSQEITISAANFVLPLFIHEGEDDVPIEAMPGCSILGWRNGLLDEVYKARDVGVKSFLLFQKTPNALKIPTTDGLSNDNGLIPQTIRLLKDKYPDIVIYTDVALDPYSRDGYDGIARQDGVIMNDETVHQLCKQAVSQARAGADVVSPSIMLDGRVGAIRVALDADGFHDVSIMTNTAKHTNTFYSPFREDLDSNLLFGDKKTYQMNPANYREVINEMEDTSEGADILLVKPGLPFLDIIRVLRDNSSLPIAAYQDSCEYSMIKACDKVLDVEKVMMEFLLCLRRAGASIIFTYFARQAASVLAGGN